MNRQLFSSMALLLVLAGCGRMADAPEDTSSVTGASTAPATTASAPAPAPSATGFSGSGFDTPGTHFTLDRTSGQAFSFPFGNDPARLLTQVGTATGIRLSRVSSAGVATVIDTSYSFFPQGWLGSSGAELVCFTRMTGAPTPESGSGVPDPRNGSVIVCRLDPGTGTFQPEISFAKSKADTKALFLLRVQELSGAFVVTYYEDRFGTFTNQPSDFASRVFQRTLVNGAFGPPAPGSI